MHASSRLDRCEGFGDLAAWAYLVVRANYASVADSTRRQLDQYASVWTSIGDAIESDLVLDPSGHGPAHKTRARLKDLSNLYPVDLMAHALLRRIDSLVGTPWRNSALIDGLRRPLNRVYQSEVEVLDRRRSLIAKLQPDNVLRDRNESELTPPYLPGPVGPVDEAYKLTTNIVFIEPHADYSCEFVAAGWVDCPGGPPDYQGVSFVGDCVVQDWDHLHWEPTSNPFLERVGDDSKGSDQSAERTRIEAVFQRASRERARIFGATIVVLPELTADATLFAEAKRVAAAANVEVAVLGSRHVSDESFRRNQSETLYWNSTRSKHNKTCRFELNGRFEDIDIDPRIMRFVDSPIGRICTLICKDFLSDEVLSILTRASPDFVLVPAMTAHGIQSDFADHARDLARRTACATFVVNTCSVLRQTAETKVPVKIAAVGFLALPFKPPRMMKEYSCTPSRVPTFSHRIERQIT